MLGGLLGTSWGLLAASWGPLGASWGLLEAEGSKFPSGTPVWAPSWSRLGGLLGRLGGLLGRLGSWGPFGPSWGRLGGLLGSWFLVLGFLGSSWFLGRLGASGSRKRQNPKNLQQLFEKL